MAVNHVTRLSRLDDQIADLRSRLDVKLNERKDVLDAMIADGETIRAEAITNDRFVLSQAATLLQTGRQFTDAQVRDIRRRQANGESQHSIGKRYGVSQPTIHRIIYRLSYGDVA